MKRFTILTAMLVLAFLVSAGFAQEAMQTDKAPDTAYLVMEDNTLNAAVMSGEISLKGGQDFKANKAVVVVVGPAVKALVHGSKMEPELKKAMDSGVRIVACESAMKKMNVDPENLMEGVDKTPNGFFEIFKLEQKGYLTLQL
ncbi:MAG: DsrE family protein [Calditrichia bacterium]